VPSILVVDDNDQLRGMINRGLTLAGHDVVEAANGKAALAQLEGLRFDVILTDIVMPDMEGLELIRLIRKQDATARIIAMSGGGRGTADDYLAFASRFGAAVTLEKPFTIEELTKAIDAVLRPHE
jgi:two-component system, response regulator, stage 0 sporulation protein F